MAVNYKLQKYKNQGSEYNGHYYAKAVMTDCVDLNTLAERIQENCTAKKSDVLVVLTELVNVLVSELQASHRVKINGFGSFKMGIKGSFVPDIASFNAGTHIRGLRVNFQPEWTTDSSGNRVNNMTSGAKIKEYSEYTKA